MTVTRAPIIWDSVTQELHVLREAIAQAQGEVAELRETIDDKDNVITQCLAARRDDAIEMARLRTALADARHALATARGAR